MLPGRKFTIDDAVRILVRRAWIIVIPCSIGLSFAPIISKKVKQLYRSETLIMVIPQRVPDSYVKSTITAKMEERLPSISNVILSRSRLERVVRDFNLYPEISARGIMEDVVQRLRRDIGPVKLEGQDSFRISYVSNHPQTAQKVTARIASLYIEENLTDRANLAEETNLFVESQLNDAKQRLLEHEKKLEAYRKRYTGQLPSELQSNLQMIQTTQMQLQTLGEAANRIRERRLLIERQIADIESTPAAALAVATGDGAGQQALTPAQQLESLQGQLDLARQRLKANHPDLRALERAVATLQAKVKEQANPTPATAKAADPNPNPAVHAREKRIRDLRAELDVIDHQLSTNQAEDAKLKARVDDYQGKVEGVPTRESELVELTRDYSTLQSAYMTLLTKREDSKISANLERRQIGEQFRILDPASLPERPYNQSQRLGFISSGAIAGLGIGILIVGFLEFRDSSFRREEDVVRALSLTVLAIVPMMSSQREQRAARLQMIAVNTIAGVALLGSTAIVAYWRMLR